MQARKITVMVNVIPLSVLTLSSPVTCLYFRFISGGIVYVFVCRSMCLCINICSKGKLTANILWETKGKVLNTNVKLIK